jgi:hypothetical protein
MFHFGSKSSRRAMAEEPAPAAAAVGVVTNVDAAVAKVGAASTQEVVELLEADLKRSGKRMETTGRETKARVGETVKIVEELRHDTDRLVEQTGAARQNMAALADGFHELQATAEEIGRRAET